MKTFEHRDGMVLCADATARGTMEAVTADVSAGSGTLQRRTFPLIMADPPYGGIIKKESWDNVKAITGYDIGTLEAEKTFVEWMLSWTSMWSEALVSGGAMYVWGGVGLPGFRPFYGYLQQVERATGLSLSTHITWKKKRAYGIQWGYLFCREELAYLVKGEPKKPRTFHVPLTDKLRGYAGYDKAHPAKSDFLRRSNVWTEDGPPGDPADAPEYRMSDVWDETEIMRGKRHECEKAKRVNEIPIEVHTEPGETVIDLFAGSGSAAEAARRLGRRWIAIERDEAMCAAIDANMKACSA